MAEFEEQVPWHDLYDELSGQTADDDDTFYELTSPGSSREPLAGPAVPPRMPGQGFQEPPRVLPSFDPVDMRDSSVRPRDDIAAPWSKRSRRSDADMPPTASPTHWTPGPPQPSDPVPPVTPSAYGPVRGRGGEFDEAAAAAARARAPSPRSASRARDSSPYARTAPTSARRWKADALRPPTPVPPAPPTTTRQAPAARETP